MHAGFAWPAPPADWLPGLSMIIGATTRIGSASSFLNTCSARPNSKASKPQHETPSSPSSGFLAGLPEEERKRLGRAGITPEEANATFIRGEEMRLQKLVVQWLDLHQIYWESDRMDKRTSGKRGRADFRICVPPGGYWLSAECKACGQPLEKEQAQQAVRLRNSGGHFVLVYRLNDLIEAIQGIHADDK